MTRPDLYETELRVDDLVWADDPYAGPAMVQCSAHGQALPAEVSAGALHWRDPQRRVASGQSVVFYDPSNRYVLGGGIAR